jgi:hypothetical protein
MDVNQTDLLEKYSPLLHRALAEPAIHTAEHVAAHLFGLVERQQVDGTLAGLQVHCVCSDGNQRVMVDELAEKLASIVLHYSIPRTRVKEAIDLVAATGNAEPLVRLDAEARSLFTHIANTGEGGEVLLYWLTEALLGYPQILCKMPLKTSPSMHVHGVDGVHATMDGNRLAVYWGESKLYQSATSAMSAAMTGVSEFLLSSGASGDRADRDLLLLRDNANLAGPEVTEAVRAFFVPGSRLRQNLEFRAVCLVGFDHGDYPSQHDELVEILKKLGPQIEKWRLSLQSAVAKARIEGFVIEVFCVPFPDVVEFRKAFLRQLRVSVVTEKAASTGE